jgi:hypothetical protein
VLSTHAYSESLNAVKRQASIREYSWITAEPIRFLCKCFSLK